MAEKNEFNLGDYPEGPKDRTGNGKRLTEAMIKEIEDKEKPYIEPR